VRLLEKGRSTGIAHHSPLGVPADGAWRHPARL